MDRLTTIFDICLYFTGCMMIGVVVVALALILREAYLTITKDKEEVLTACENPTKSKEIG